MNAVPDGPDVEVDARLIAPELGLNLEAFRRLMSAGRISVLCERGTAADEGLVRATFYYGRRRARLVVNEHGDLVDGAAARRDRNE